MAGRKEEHTEGRSYQMVGGGSLGVEEEEGEDR